MLNLLRHICAATWTSWVGCSMGLNGLGQICPGFKRQPSQRVQWSEGSHWDGYSFLPLILLSNQFYTKVTPVVPRWSVLVCPTVAITPTVIFLSGVWFCAFCSHQDIGPKSYSWFVSRALSRVSLCCAGVAHNSTLAVENFYPKDFVVLGNGVLCTQTTFGRNWAFIYTVMKQKAKIRNTCEKFPIFYWGERKVNRIALADS